MIRRYAQMLDAGGASGVSCHFTTITGVSDTAYYHLETLNIVGAAGAVVFIQVQNYFNNNSSGEIDFNGSTVVFQNTALSVTLDGSGNGSFTAKCFGNPTDTQTEVSCTFWITGVTFGQVSPGGGNAQNVFKVF